MKTTIGIPALNEEKNIGAIITKLKKISDSIIVCDDGSTDLSRKLLEENKNLYDKLLLNDVNQGKGFSVKKGILNCSGTHIIFQDGDLEYDPNDFKKFEKVFKEFEADAIIGSRFIYSNFTRSHNILNKFGNNILTLIFNILYNTTFTDIYSCYFAFKKELLNAEKLRTNGFEQHPIWVTPWVLEKH